MREERSDDEGIVAFRDLRFANGLVWTTDGTVVLGILFVLKLFNIGDGDAERDKEPDDEDDDDDDEDEELVSSSSVFGTL